MQYFEATIQIPNKLTLRTRHCSVESLTWHNVLVSISCAVAAFFSLNCCAETIELMSVADISQFLHKFRLEW